MRLCQNVYGNTMLQFDANANVDASVNEAVQHVIIFNFNLFKAVDLILNPTDNPPDYPGFNVGFASYAF